MLRSSTGGRDDIASPCLLRGEHCFEQWLSVTIDPSHSAAKSPDAGGAGLSPGRLRVRQARTELPPRGLDGVEVSVITSG